MRSAAPQVGASVTPYHMQLNRTDWLGWGNRPYMYCMPVIKTEQDRLAIRQGRDLREACFFLGTDSAPHPVARKLGVVGSAGLFNSPVCIETYAQIFEEDGKLENFEAVRVSERAEALRTATQPRHDHAEKTSWKAPEEVLFDGPEERALIYRGGEEIPWKVVSA